MFRNSAVDAYLSMLDPVRREALASLRALIFESLPDAEEQFRNDMPFYHGDGDICAFASRKRYLSLYLMDTAVLDKHRQRLGELDCGRGCIRFGRFEELPVPVIRAMLLEIREKNRAGNERPQVIQAQSWSRGSIGRDRTA
jgi:uncharacterized protein YdhG (YjbR/CyaY superfamily)